MHKSVVITQLQLERWLKKQWQVLNVWTLLLSPLSAVFWLIVKLRKLLYQFGLFSSTKLVVPVIVVGNITVGGTGKTPLVIWLVTALREQGFKPAVISRGFGVNIKTVQEVLLVGDATDVGDEPLLIKRRANCPVFVGKNRVNVGLALLKQYPEIDVIVSDDGLQHYALKRDVEIAVVDGVRGLGNHFLLPAGPLREPVTRLQCVDTVVVNGVIGSSFVVNKTINMQLAGQTLVNIRSQKTMPVLDILGKKIHAIAGIGNPNRFFDALKKLGLRVEQTAFADHHSYVAADFANIQADYVLMTEKDAVKCRAFAKDNWWYLPVSAEVDNALIDAILNKLQKI